MSVDLINFKEHDQIFLEEFKSDLVTLNKIKKEMLEDEKLTWENFELYNYFKKRLLKKLL